MICGDLNARTGSLPDYNPEEGNKHIFGNSYPQDLVNFKRNSFDKITNKHGKSLIELCKSLGLYLLNGRVRGGSLGRYTYSSSLGCSTVEYMITDLDPFSFKALTVKPLTPLSDHSQATLYFKIRNNPNACRGPSNLYNTREKYKWAEHTTETYLQAFCQPQVSLMIENVLMTTYPHNKEGVNIAVKRLNDIFNYLASICNLKTTKKAHKNNHMKKMTKNEKWFDRDCETTRKKLGLLSNQKHRQPDDPDLRLSYYNELRKYKSTLGKKGQFIQNQLETIEHSLNSNDFWNNLNTLNKKQHEELAIQNGDVWKSHFENLYSKCGINPEQTQIEK